MSFFQPNLGIVSPNQSIVIYKYMRASMNPYATYLKLIFDRIKWDLCLESWSSRAKLRSLHNSCNRNKAVILCNGPSLNKVDFDLLSESSAYTFGLNKINLIFERTQFRPDSIVAVNDAVIEQNTDFFRDTSIELFLSASGISSVGRKKNVTYLHTTRYQKFATDCSISVVPGYTVTYVALQLAYHMGFRQVALVGCDHNFATKGPPNKTIVAGASDPNHFDPRYFSGGVKWQLPDLVGSEYFYNLADQAFTSDDRKVFNCTEGGELELFERKSLKAFL